MLGPLIPEQRCAGQPQDEIIIMDLGQKGPEDYTQVHKSGSTEAIQPVEYHDYHGPVVYISTEAKQVWQ